MTGAAKSRWADTEEDAAFEEKRRKEKEEKKRLKAAERARKEAAAAAAAAEAAGAQAQSQADADGSHNDGRPSKRRKVTPEAGNGQRPASKDAGKDDDGKITNTEGSIVRITGGTLPEPCGSVEGYDKLNDISEGAYGWVTRARSRRTGEVMALKRLKLDLADRSGIPVTGLREIQLLRDCRHRNVVRLHEVVVGDRRPIDNILLVLEFAEHDLKSILEDMPQPFLTSEVKTLLGQLAAGVEFLHSRWILHRDLKTSNLLLTNRGQLKIADFGMARYYSADDITNGGAQLTSVVVTLWYRAPELLLRARHYGPAIDMWSVGCIFAELLTREPLLPGKNEADELARIFRLCGFPTDATWPSYLRLAHDRGIRIPPMQTTATVGASIRAMFPQITTAGCDLLSSLLSLESARRPTATEMLDHEYFRQSPRAKREELFPTFPSRAGQERRRRHNTPDAPQRGDAAADPGTLDFASVFGNRDHEERGAGFSLRMV